MARAWLCYPLLYFSAFQEWFNSLLSDFLLQAKNKHAWGARGFLTSQHRELVPSRRQTLREIQRDHSPAWLTTQTPVVPSSKQTKYSWTYRENETLGVLCSILQALCSNARDLSSHHLPEPAIVSPFFFFFNTKNQMSILFLRFWTY